MDKYFEANAVLSLFCKNYMELKKGLPIRPSEMGVLNIVVQTPGPHTSVMIAELLGVQTDDHSAPDFFGREGVHH